MISTAHKEVFCSEREKPRRETGGEFRIWPPVRSEGIIHARGRTDGRERGKGGRAKSRRRRSKVGKRRRSKERSVRGKQENKEREQRGKGKKDRCETLRRSELLPTRSCKSQRRRSTKKKRKDKETARSVKRASTSPIREKDCNSMVRCG